MASALAGLPMGVAWWLLAPLPEVAKRADGLFRAGGESDESAVAADGWFALLALVTGILVALVVYLRTRPGRVAPLVGLAVGGAVGAVVAWRTGMLLGPGPVASTASGLPVGSTFDGPLDVSALGVLLAWPMGAVITCFAVAAGADAAGVEDSYPRGAAIDAGAVSPADPAEQSEHR